MNDLSEFVVLSDTTLTTDSRRVAKHFKKRHDNVLQAFDRLECGEEFSRLNFQVAEEMDSQGKPRRIVNMTKDECGRLMEWIEAFAAERGVLLGVDMETGEIK